MIRILITKFAGSENIIYFVSKSVFCFKNPSTMGTQSKGNSLKEKKNQKQLNRAIIYQTQNHQSHQ